jgi:hypothetical protein
MTLWKYLKNTEQPNTHTPWCCLYWLMLYITEDRGRKGWYFYLWISEQSLDWGHEICCCQRGGNGLPSPHHHITTSGNALELSFPHGTRPSRCQTGRPRPMPPHCRLQAPWRAWPPLNLWRTLESMGAAWKIQRKLHSANTDERTKQSWLEIVRLRSRDDSKRNRILFRFITSKHWSHIYTCRCGIVGRHWMV